MARAFVASSSQRLVATGVPPNVPMSMACWYYPTQTATGQILMSVCDANDVDRHQLAWGPLSNNVQATSVDSLGSDAAVITVTPSNLVNKWNFLCGTWTSFSRRDAYTGTATASSSAEANITGLDTVVVGAYVASSSYAGHFDGYIAHAVIWNVALSGAEVARLYNNGIGADPRSVRPDALVAYWPLLNNDGDQDYWGNYHLTASGSPTYAQHPPVLMRSRPKYVILGAGAPSIATIEIAGTRQVGNTLTCNATSSPSGGTFAYQWYMADDIAGTNQTAISGATSQTYELSYANIGAATKLYEGLDANGEAFIACGATPTKDAVEGDETVSSYVSITEAAATAPVGSPFESAYIR